ncbi:MAG: hypothetical protein AAGA20_18650 [Planctomycetota bacterium]
MTDRQAASTAASPCPPGIPDASSVLWVFVPVVALLAFAVWQRSRTLEDPASFGAPDAPERGGAGAIVSGWASRVELSDVVLGLRLEPLHSLASRQAFDATALAARFRGASPHGGALAEEPWRLTLDATSRAPVEQPRSALPDLASIRIEGLEPLVPVDGAQATRVVHDPLATLLQLPTGPLLEGRSCDLVFWGPRPVDEVVLTAGGLAEPVVLLPTKRTVASPSESIARLDARDPEPESPR